MLEVFIKLKSNLNLNIHLNICTINDRLIFIKNRSGSDRRQP
jgi:hypothetical protein